MDEQTLALLASAAVSAALLVVVWRRTDPVKTKLGFSALLLIPIFGPLGYIIILGLSDAPPQDKRLQNLGSYGDYTQFSISMNPIEEASLARLRNNVEEGSTETGEANNDDSIDVAFEPAQGWILVAHGSLSAIESAIIQYDSLYLPERPGSFRIQLHPQSDGSVAVMLPDGLPAYDLANLTGWLNDPPDQSDVSDAVAWITAPADGTRYYLEPDPDNPFGDTLVGASSTGQSVRVYLPETGLIEDCADRSYREEQGIETSANPTTMTVRLDTNTSFGNPQFRLSAGVF